MLLKALLVSSYFHTFLQSLDQLGECIKSCFEILDIPVPDIDVTRDKKEIMAFMRQRVLDKLDSARTFEELSVAS